MKQKCIQHIRVSSRRGSMLVEAMVGAIIIGTAMTMLVPGLTVVRRQRQALRFETLALVELNNISDFLPELKTATDGTSPAEEVAQIFEPPLQLSSWFIDRYAKAQVRADVLPRSPDGAEKGIQGIRLTIQQPAFEFMPDKQVSLVVWKKTEETTP